jgi:hypothetical protein
VAVQGAGQVGFDFGGGLLPPPPSTRHDRMVLRPCPEHAARTRNASDYGFLHLAAASALRWWTGQFPCRKTEALRLPPDRIAVAAERCIEYTALSRGCNARLALLTALGVTARFTARPGCIARRTLRGTSNLEKKPTCTPKRRNDRTRRLLSLRTPALNKTKPGNPTDRSIGHSCNQPTDPPSIRSQAWPVSSGRTGPTTLTAAEEYGFTLRRGRWECRV